MHSFRLSKRRQLKKRVQRPLVYLREEDSAEVMEVKVVEVTVAAAVEAPAEVKVKAAEEVAVAALVEAKVMEIMVLMEIMVTL